MAKTSGMGSIDPVLIAGGGASLLAGMTNTARTVGFGPPGTDAAFVAGGLLLAGGGSALSVMIGRCYVRIVR